MPRERRASARREPALQDKFLNFHTHTTERMGHGICAVNDWICVADQQNRLFYSLLCNGLLPSFNTSASTTRSRSPLKTNHHHIIMKTKARFLLVVAIGCVGTSLPGAEMRFMGTSETSGLGPFWYHSLTYGNLYAWLSIDRGYGDITGSSGFESLQNAGPISFVLGSEGLLGVTSSPTMPLVVVEKYSTTSISFSGTTLSLTGSLLNLDINTDTTSDVATGEGVVIVSGRPGDPLYEEIRRLTGGSMVLRMVIDHFAAVQYNVNSATYATTGKFIVEAVPGTMTYSGWVSRLIGDAGQWGALDDPDHDGISNLMEFMEDTDPAHPDGTSSPSISVITAAGQDYPCVTFRRRTSAFAGGATLVALASTGIDGSGPLDLVEVSATPNAIGTVETVIARSNIPIANAAHQFFRLQASLPGQ